LFVIGAIGLQGAKRAFASMGCEGEVRAIASSMPGNGLHSTIRYMRGAAGNGLSTTAKYRVN
jgi:hypothetical protein